MTDSTALIQDDLRAILEALGLGTHARPYSPHEVVHRDILPAIQRLRWPMTSFPTDAEREAARRALVLSGAHPGDYLDVLRALAPFVAAREEQAEHHGYVRALHDQDVDIEAAAARAALALDRVVAENEALRGRVAIVEDERDEWMGKWAAEKDAVARVEALIEGRPRLYGTSEIRAALDGEPDAR